MAVGAHRAMRVWEDSEVGHGSKASNNGLREGEFNESAASRQGKRRSLRGLRELTRT